MKFHISIIAHYIKRHFILVLTHKFQFIFLSNNVTLSYNNVFVTVSFEMSDNALFQLSPIRPFETKHLLDLVCSEIIKSAFFKDRCVMAVKSCRPIWPPLSDGWRPNDIFGGHLSIGRRYVRSWDWGLYRL